MKVLDCSEGTGGSVEMDSAVDRAVFSEFFPRRQHTQTETHTLRVENAT